LDLARSLAVCLDLARTSENQKTPKPQNLWIQNLQDLCPTDFCGNAKPQKFVDIGNNGILWKKPTNFCKFWFHRYCSLFFATFLVVLVPMLLVLVFFFPTPREKKREGKKWRKEKNLRWWKRFIARSLVPEKKRASSEISVDSIIQTCPPLLFTAFSWTGDSNRRWRCLYSYACVFHPGVAVTHGHENSKKQNSTEMRIFKQHSQRLDSYSKPHPLRKEDAWPWESWKRKESVGEGPLAWKQSPKHILSVPRREKKSTSRCHRRQ